MIPLRLPHLPTAISRKIKQMMASDQTTFATPWATQQITLSVGVRFTIPLRNAAYDCASLHTYLPYVFPLPHVRPHHCRFPLRHPIVLCLRLSIGFQHYLLYSHLYLSWSGSVVGLSGDTAFVESWGSYKRGIT